MLFLTLFLIFSFYWYCSIEDFYKSAWISPKHILLPPHPSCNGTSGRWVIEKKNCLVLMSTLREVLTFYFSPLWNHDSSSSRYVTHIFEILFCPNHSHLYTHPYHVHNICRFLQHLSNPIPITPAIILLNIQTNLEQEQVLQRWVKLYLLK